MRRKEIKFQVPPTDLAAAEHAVRRAFSARATYPKRLVSSLYFDTPELRSFTESEEGVVPREKIRLRWYGKAIPSASHPVSLEIKQSKAYYREKYTVMKGSYESFRQFRRGSLLAGLQETAVTRYLRKYFEGSGIRITVDYHIRGEGLGLLGRGVVELDYCVIEIKGPPEILEGDLERLTKLRASRSSKYCDVVNRFKNHPAPLLLAPPFGQDLNARNC